VEYQFAFIGRRGYSHFQKRVKVWKYFNDIPSASPQPRDASRIAKRLEKAFLEEGFDRVIMLCNEFISPLSQIPQVRPLLPLDTSDLPDETLENAGTDMDILAEPEMGKLLSFVIPRLVTFKVFYAL